VRIFIIYEPFKFMMRIGMFVFLIGFALGLRFLWYFFSDSGEGHIQSLILASILLVMGFQTIITAFIADLLAANRKLMEDVQFRIRNLESNNSKTNNK